MKKVNKLNNNKFNIHSNLLFKTQLRLSHLKKKGWRFEEDEKIFALSLHYTSPKAYMFMCKMLCSPTIISLQKWLQRLEVTCGFNENILQMLNTRFVKSPPSEKVISIIFDEMSIKKLISYNSSNDTLFVFDDLGEIIE